MAKVLVERETYEKNGKSYFAYYVKGVIRGRNVRILMVPPDKGGYTVLDIVFGDAMTGELVAKPFEFKDETGRTISGNSYTVQTVDENGEVYECPVKPNRMSDKALLNMLLNQAA